MYVCEDCRDKVGAHIIGTSPSRKVTCKRCGKEDWCFRALRITNEIEFTHTPCVHIRAISDDLELIIGWRDDPDKLKYHDITFVDCPTCSGPLWFGRKRIKDWDISGT